MTLRDDPRTYKKPVEEVAEALRASFREAVTKAADMTFAETGVSVPSDAVWNRYAEAAIERLRKCGFISDLGIEAIRAEEAGK